MKEYDKSEAERKARRDAEDLQARQATNEVQGRGEHWSVQDRQSNEVIKRAIDGGWITAPQRWPTDCPVDQIGTETPKDIAVRATIQSMLSADAGVANPAVANIIKMEAQNQADQRKPEPQILQQFNLPTSETPSSVIQKLLADPQYLEFARLKALEAGVQTSTNKKVTDDHTPEV